jgi:hypothetical protein
MNLRHRRIYVSLLGLDGDTMDWNYLDADDDAEIKLF